MERRDISILITSISLIAIATIGCTKSKTYEEIQQEELAKEVRYDSLFYGIHFNMTTPAFLEHCWKMNQKKIFFQNGVKSEVVVKFDDEFKYPVTFVFFPNLEKDLIQELHGKFSYYGRSSFRKDRGAGVLIKDVVTQMEEWYGGRKFIKMPSPKKWEPDIYVKIDGNRKITLKEDQVTGEVDVLYEDLKKIL